MLRMPLIGGRLSRHGIFELLTGDAAVEAIRRISSRERSTATLATVPNAAAFTYVTREGAPGVTYCVRITDKRGRRSASTF